MGGSTAKIGLMQHYINLFGRTSMACFGVAGGQRWER